MAIRVLFVGRATERARGKAFVNLCALSLQLPLPHIVLLDGLGAEIELHSQRSWRSGMTNAVVLDIDSLLLFAYRQRRVGREQRQALALLKRSVVYWLDDQFGFTRQRAWRRAARAEHPQATQRAWASIKPSDVAPSEADRDSGVSSISYVRRLLRPLQSLITGAISEERWLLGEIQLLRDVLSAMHPSTPRLHEQMKIYFPNTYALVQEFDAQLDHRATAMAMVRFPNLASDPATAMAAVRAGLELIWPPDLPLPKFIR